MLSAANVILDRGGARILHGVSLDVQAGELLAVIGPNGAGKSTLLQLMSGDMAPTAGAVTLDGASLRSIPRKDLARRRAVLPQSSSLAFPFTVHEVVMMGRMPFTIRAETRQDREIVDAAIGRAGIAHLAHRKYPTLSGGERQRTHFARALAQIWEAPLGGENAPYLLLDEPTSSLDLQHQHILLGLVRSMAREGVGVMVVLHDLNLALTYADRVAVLEDGAVRAAGPAAEIVTPAMTADVFGVTAEIFHRDNHAYLAIVGA